MSKQYQHTFAEGIEEGVVIQGEQVYRPSVSYPMFTTKGLPFWKKPFEKYWRPQCGCGIILDNMDRYREHFIYQAVWQNESGYIPKEISKAIRQHEEAQQKQHKYLGGGE